MSRFIPHGDMTAEQILDNSYDLLAVLLVGEAAAKHLHDNHEPALADSLSRLFALAVELHGPLHDALESHEGAKGGAT